RWTGRSGRCSRRWSASSECAGGRRRPRDAGSERELHLRTTRSQGAGGGGGALPPPRRRGGRLAPAVAQGRGRAAGDPRPGRGVRGAGAGRRAAAAAPARGGEPGAPGADRGGQGAGARPGRPARVPGAGRLGVTGPKHAVRVFIGGEEYTVRSELPPEYTREVAAYLDAALRRVRDSLPSVESHKA